MHRQYLDLSIALAKAGFKLRNEGSYLGLFWYLLNPLLTFGLLLVVFSGNLGADIESYPLYLLLGIIMFNFFQQATYESTKIIDSNRNIIKSVKFPLSSLITSTVIKCLFSHFFEIVVFAGLMVFLKVPLQGILLYPLVLVLFSAFTLGVCLSLAALFPYFVDLENIWLFVSKLLLFATPIFYSLDSSSPIFFLNVINPLYCFLTAARDVTIYLQAPEQWVVVGMFVWTSVSLVTGIFMFNALKGRFAELI